MPRPPNRPTTVSSRSRSRNPSDTDTVIGYTVTGDATAGSDYTALSGTVTISAGPDHRHDRRQRDRRNPAGRQRDGHGHARQRSRRATPISRSAARQLRHRHDHRRRHGRSHHRGQRCQRRPNRPTMASSPSRISQSVSDTDTVDQLHGHRRCHGGQRLHGTVGYGHDSRPANHRDDRRQRDRRQSAGRQRDGHGHARQRSRRAMPTSGSARPVSDTVTITDDDTAEVTIAANDGSGGRTGRRRPVHGHRSRNPSRYRHGDQLHASPATPRPAATTRHSRVPSRSWPADHGHDRRVGARRQPAGRQRDGHGHARRHHVGRRRYQIGGTISDTVTITDDDTAEVTIAANDASGRRTGQRRPVHRHHLAIRATPTR